eukprot:4134822-Pleurochrysis_carterae.AAC.1
MHLSFFPSRLPDIWAAREKSKETRHTPYAARCESRFFSSQAMLKLKKRYEVAVEERNYTGIQVGWHVFS